MSIEEHQNLFRVVDYETRAKVGGLAIGGFIMKKRLETLGGRCSSRNRDDGESGAVVWFKVPFTPSTEGQSTNSNINAETSSEAFLQVLETLFQML